MSTILLNEIIEQYRGFIMKRVRSKLGYKSFKIETYILKGIETIFQAYCTSTKLYKTLAVLPSYKDLVERKNLQIVQEKMDKLWERPAFYGDYSSQIVEEFKEWGWIGEDTPNQPHNSIVNFMGLLQDQRYFLRSQSINEVNLIEDGGLRYMSYGNAAGGTYSGDYRYFVANLIKYAILRDEFRKEYMYATS